MILPGGTSIPPQIREEGKFFPYFQDCLGALDGAHITVSIRPSLAAAFRNRKGTTSHNMLGFCTFNMSICYVLCGWEGSAHDGRVLQDAFTKDFIILDGKYFLVDAGYGLLLNVLIDQHAIIFWNGNKGLTSFRTTKRSSI